MKKKVVVFGTADTAELAYYYLESDSELEVVAFTLTKNFLSKKDFLPRGSKTQYPVVEFEKLQDFYPPSEFLLFSPMTGVKMNTLREKIYLQGKEKGYEHASYVSSKASRFNNQIGENCFILEDNTLQPFTDIGNNVVLWSGNHIGHHGKIDDHVFFTSHVVMSGHCHIKNNCWIGVNSTLRDGITLEEKTLVAMGSLITKNTETNGFYVGLPAKKQERASIEVV
jgi:sugar O-acyltransferase (sialic acid O-acetyltransferase NeuD family)